MGPALVLVIRLLVPLTIFRSPLWGGLLAIVADMIDILIFQWLGFPDSIGYHEVDELLDIYYLSIEVIVAQTWDAMPCAIAAALFVFRLIGVALFEITGNRLVLFVFPNLFELFFLVCAYTRAYRPTYILTGGTAAVWLAVLLVPKMAQEYVLHYGKLLDDLVALDIIRDAATSVSDTIRRLA